MKSTLIAIQDEINQYHEGNLTLEMCLNGIESLIKDLRNEQVR
jgi:hypothetical protein